MESQYRYPIGKVMAEYPAGKLDPEEGALTCAMEVSSIGLDQGRVNGAAFDTAVFTNLTRDHLEYHGSMEAYGAAKEALFAMPGLKAAVVNLDDPFGARLAAKLAGRLRTIGYTLEGRRGGDETLAAEDLAMTPTGLTFTLNKIRIEAPVVGRFNAANLLAVTGALLAGDEELGDIADVLRHITAPPGRMQAVGGRNEPLVVVDYAHTPDALETVLHALRPHTERKLVAVFGCGGDRDKGKRPLMGAAAAQFADRVIVTDDNPRTEEAAAIRAEILAAVPGASEIAGRADAIHTAIAELSAGDVLVIAGKGHEAGQIVGTTVHPFSDRDEAIKAARSLGGREYLP